MFPSTDTSVWSPLPSNGCRGSPLQEPCGSPPSSVLWVHKTAQHPSRRLWSPLAIGTSHGKEEMRSSLRFLDNPLGSVPRAIRLRRPQHDLAITVAAGCCLP